jgi:hypothetical protein
LQESVSPRLPFFLHGLPDNIYRRNIEIAKLNDEHLEPSSITGAGKPDMNDPCVVLALLEADQVVAVKQSRFGRRPLSLGIRMLLWALRGYVVIMLIIVVISVIHAMNPTP